MASSQHSVQEQAETVRVALDYFEPGDRYTDQHEYIVAAHAALNGLLEQYEGACEVIRQMEFGKVEDDAEHLRLKEQYEGEKARADRNQHHLNVERDANAKTVKWLNEQYQALERFEDEVRDVMDFMPHDEHYVALNAALGRIRSNPAREPDVSEREQSEVTPRSQAHTRVTADPGLLRENQGASPRSETSGDSYQDSEPKEEK